MNFMKTAKTRTLYAVVAALLALVVMLEIGYIAVTHPYRKDLSRRKFYTLSSRTQKILQTLDRDIKVKMLFPEDHPLFHDVENLLDEYQSAAPRQISVRWIDPVSDLGLVEKLNLEYGLANESGQIELPVVVFDCGDGEAVRKVRLFDLVDMERVEGRKDPVITAFKGEQAFSGAIYGLVHGENPKVYFLSGHGEPSIEDTAEQNGLSSIREIAVRENYNLAELVLQPSSEIPRDADILVVAGPREEFAPYEVDMVERYLDRAAG